jgi:hypothetical protein
MGSTKSREIREVEIEHSKESTLSNMDILPPIKTILNEQIASTAIETIRDSKALANTMAKAWISEALADKTTPKKFGDILNRIFSYESVRSI